MSYCRFFLAFIALTVVHPLKAQTDQEKLTLGIAAEYRIKLSSIPAGEKCNIQITVTGVEPIEVELTKPNFEIVLPVQGSQKGMLEVNWQGKTKWRGLNSVAACPGSGKKIYQVETMPIGKIRELWAAYYAGVSKEQAECVRIGLDVSNLKADSADPEAVLVAPQSSEVKKVYEKCDILVAQYRALNRDKECVLRTNNIRTRCAETFVTQRDGQTVRMTTREVVEDHFAGKKIAIGMAELLTAKSARETKEAEEKKKEADALAAHQAREAAERERAEQERKFKESPEYKRQQQELERKRLADERVKEAAEKKRLADEVRIREAEEKKQAAEARAKEAAEKKRLADEARIREAEEKKRLAQQAGEKKAPRFSVAEKNNAEAIERARLANGFPFHVEVTCNNGGYGSLPASACFNADNMHFEVQNGAEYNFYSFMDVINLNAPPNTDDVIRIELRQKFRISIQNGGQGMSILGLRIFRKQTGEIVFEKKVSRYGVIKVAN